MKTMHQVYDEPADELGAHECCEVCGHCFTCGDCTCENPNKHETLRKNANKKI